jgi:hypothetical protein
MGMSSLTAIGPPMKITKIAGWAMIAGFMLAGFGCATEEEEHEGKESKLAAQAKVSRADAEKTALARVPGGTIKEGGIEKEKGKLIWSFDIATAGTKDITEVQVDALTGQIVAMDKETAADEAKEKKNQGKEKEEDEKSDKK